MNIFIAIIAFVIVVGVLVLVHELGHFLAARQAGVTVEEFGFGFPPRLATWKRKHTTLSLNWIPLGGFVKIKGIAGDDEHAGEHRGAKDSFANQSYWRRLFILVAGILMNIILCAILLTAVYALGFSQSVTGEIIQTQLAPGQVTITGLVSGGPAEKAGVVVGDEIKSVNTLDITSIYEAQTSIASHEDLVQIEIRHQGELREFTVPVGDIGEGQQGIGVGLGIHYPIWVAPWLGIRETTKLVGFVFVGLFELLKSLVTQGKVGEGVVGPVGIAVISGQAVQLGVVYIFYFAALLSANLAVFNLLPLPALDGGRLLFLLIERIQGKPVNAKIEGIVHTIGFIGLLVLAVLVTFRDVIHLVR